MAEFPKLAHSVWPARQAGAGDMLLLKTQRPTSRLPRGGDQPSAGHVSRDRGATREEEGEEGVILCRNVLRAARAG